MTSCPALATQKTPPCSPSSTCSTAWRPAASRKLSSRKALAATELIFATYEISRRRGRVTLPLEIDDLPLLTGLEQGLWKPV